MQVTPPGPVTEGQDTVFTLSLSNGLTIEEDVLLVCGTVDGTATTGTDYRALSPVQEVTIAAGSPSTTCTVRTLPDMEEETDETFDPIIGTRGSPPAWVTVAPDPYAPPPPSSPPQR